MRIHLNVDLPAERTEVPPGDSTQKKANTSTGATKESTWDGGPVKAIKITT